MRKLMLHSQGCSRRTFVAPSMINFAAALRKYSQSLELLRTSFLDLHPSFFLQSSEEVNSAAATSKGRWPRLQKLELTGGDFAWSDLGAGQLPITPTDILIAAGTTATAMPALEIAEIEIAPRQYFYIKREPYKGFQDFRNASIDFVGFDEGEEQRILNAWAHFIGGEARRVEQTIYDNGQPSMTRYSTVVKEEDRF